MLFFETIQLVINLSIKGPRAILLLNNNYNQIYKLISAITGDWHWHLVTCNHDWLSPTGDHRYTYEIIVVRRISMFKNVSKYILSIYYDFNINKCISGLLWIIFVVYKVKGARYCTLGKWRMRVGKRAAEGYLFSSINIFTTK